MKYLKHVVIGILILNLFACGVLPNDEITTEPAPTTTVEQPQVEPTLTPTNTLTPTSVASTPTSVPIEYFEQIIVYVDSGSNELNLVSEQADLDCLVDISETENSLSINPAPEPSGTCEVSLSANAYAEVWLSEELINLIISGEASVSFEIEGGIGGGAVNILYDVTTSSYEYILGFEITQSGEVLTEVNQDFLLRIPEVGNLDDIGSSVSITAIVIELNSFGYTNSGVPTIRLNR